MDQEYVECQPSRMINSVQAKLDFGSTVIPMDDPIRILTTELDGEDGLIVTFSDGTWGAYVIEELLDLRPHREPTKTQSQPN
jgi:hypothetical protein